jgi:hypothetical protein
MMDNDGKEQKKQKSAVVGSRFADHPFKFMKA